MSNTQSESKQGMHLHELSWFTAKLDRSKSVLVLSESAIQCPCSQSDQFPCFQCFISAALEQPLQPHWWKTCWWKTWAFVVYSESLMGSFEYKSGWSRSKWLSQTAALHEDLGINIQKCLKKPGWNKWFFMFYLGELSTFWVQVFAKFLEFLWSFLQLWYTSFEKIIFGQGRV